jgi:hypothetical protein
MAIKSLEELEKARKALDEKEAKEVKAVRDAISKKKADLRSTARFLRSKEAREKKKREDHAKILLGVAMIWKCQNSAPSADGFKKALAEFYKDAPEKLQVAEFGLSLVVKRPESDSDRDSE